MRGYMACGPWEQGPGCGPFGPYGRFGCQERRPGPGFFDGKPGWCRDDSGPESGRRRGPCQEDSGPEGPTAQGLHRRCSGRRGRDCESSDEEVRERSCSRERRDSSPGKRRGCRHHHRGPFGHGGPFGHSGLFGHRGPFAHSGPFGHRGPFGLHLGHFRPEHFERHGWGHGPGFGPFGERFGRHGDPRGPFRPDGFDFGCKNCRCNQNEGCMRGRKGGCTKNNNRDKDGDADGTKRKKNKQCGTQDKDQNATVLVQRIVVETPRSYSV